MTSTAGTGQVTVSKSSIGSTKDPAIHSCTTGTIKFTLKFKTSKPIA